jgi:hypothetical protein
VVHHNKTCVAVKQHEGEGACAIVVDDTGVFVGKGAKAECIGDGLIIDIISSMKVGRGLLLLSSLSLSGIRPGMTG